MPTFDVFPAAWPGVWLAAALLCAYAAGRWGRWAALPLAGFSLLWLFNNTLAEGGTLVELSASHGLNTTDIVGVVGLAVAGWVLLRGR